MKKIHLLSLDAIRGFAAIAVLTQHLEGRLDVRFGFSHAYLAVDFFFLMSGFVISRAYEARLTADMSFISFVKARLSRLYPLMGLGGAVGLALSLRHFSGPQETLLAAISQFSLIPLLAGGATASAYVLNPPQWSLFFEIFANIAHALASRFLSVAILTLIVLSSLAALIIVSASENTANLGWSRPTFLGGFARVGFSYTLGVLFFRLHERYHTLIPRVPLRQIQPDDRDLLHDPLPRRDVPIDDTSENPGGWRSSTPSRHNIKTLAGFY